MKGLDVFFMRLAFNFNKRKGKDMQKKIFVCFFIFLILFSFVFGSRVFATALPYFPAVR